MPRTAPVAEQTEIEERRIATSTVYMREITAPPRDTTKSDCVDHQWGLPGNHLEVSLWAESYRVAKQPRRQTKNLDWGQTIQTDSMRGKRTPAAG